MLQAIMHTNQTPFLLLHSGATRSLVATQAENPKGGSRRARVPNPKTAQISKQVAVVSAH